MSNIFENLRNIGASTSDSYLQLNIGDNSYNGRKEAGETVRSTYSMLKQDQESSWNATGTSPNVTNEILNSINDPNKYMVVNNQKFYRHSAVGMMNAEMANGVYTFHMMG